MRTQKMALAALVIIVSADCASAQQPGGTTGPAAGTNVEPSTAIQKDSSGRSVTEGGGPGVESMPGTEGGKAPEETDRTKRK
jgi:hypothetical protein